MRRKSKFTAIILTIALLMGIAPYGLKQIISEAAEYKIANPRVEKDNTVTWDCVYFGNYWQNDTNGDGVADQNDEKEPIKWRVLSVDGDDAFLLADQNLDCQPYNENYAGVTWETCTLRQWLNNNFYQNAFDSSEQSAIRTTTVVNEEYNPTYVTYGGNNTSDKVYLLSIGESRNTVFGFYDGIDDINNYNKTRESKNTEYTKGYGNYTETETGTGQWWLRSPGLTLWEASFVRGNRALYITHGKVNDAEYVVRPALHLNLSSSEWNKAGTVTDSFAARPTPTRIKPIEIKKPIQTSTPKTTPTPRARTAPTKPTKISAKNNKKKSVTLSWKKVKGATGYQIQYAANTAFAKKKLKSTKKTKLVIKKLKRKKTYSFRVRTYKLSNNVKVYSNWSKAKKVKIRK